MVAMRNLKDLTLEEKQLLASPYGFGKHYLGLPIYDFPGREKVGECRDGSQLYYDIFRSDWQKQAVNAVDVHGGKTSARTANGAGKTSTLIPTVTFWGMALHPRAKVVITSGVDRQVRSQIFPHLRACQGRFPGWGFNDTSIEAPNGSTCVGFTTKEGGYFEGWHGNKDELYHLFEHDGPLFIIVDEAKSIDQAIFDAIDRCTYQHLFLMSSCGAAEGEFYRSHNENARFFRTLAAPASLCPHADHKKNIELIQKRGLNDPLVRSKVFAEFMSNAEGAVVQREWVERCIQRPPLFSGTERAYFCDFAAGGDENVLAERIGNKTRIVAAWREKDTMRACGEFIVHFRKCGMSPSTAHLVAGDNDGLGRVVIDRMHELGWKIRRESNGDTADDADSYVNRGAETWFSGARRMELGEVIIPNDELLITQLTTRKQRTHSSGRLQLESKEDMKKRGLDSPDRADALLGVLRGVREAKSIPFANQRDASGGLLEQALNEAGIYAIPGATCE